MDIKRIEEKIWPGDKRVFLQNICDACPQMENEMRDMRGFAFAPANSPLKSCVWYVNEHITNVNFAHSCSLLGFYFKKCEFENCVFDKSFWWFANNKKTIYRNCSFKNILLYSSYFFQDARFINCCFDGMLGRGEIVDFRARCKFENCSFQDIDMSHCGFYWSSSFENCVFSGNINFFLNIIYGRKRCFWENLNSLPDLLLQTYRPVKFVNCDFTNLRVENLMMDHDVVFKNCKGVEELFRQAVKIL